MSELSTVAIKDGHRGHLPHLHHPGAPGVASGIRHNLDAERADRISRLAGLERVVAPHRQVGNLTPGAAVPPHTHHASLVPTPPAAGHATHGYFDATGNPAIIRERSTVGSASATGSVGARTTWAGSDPGDADKMSESQDMEMDVSSTGGTSEEGGTTGSLVGFGEGARTPARQNSAATPTARDAKMPDGVTHDRAVADTTTSHAPLPRREGGPDEQQRILRESMDTTSADRMREAPPEDRSKSG